MRTLIKALLSVCMLLAFASVSQAQSVELFDESTLGTPDGMPPAIESICDEEEGAAFGLCNAFCEAMDCETDNPQASATACDKVKSKYQQITGQQPPCLQSCICNELLPGFLAAANAPITHCSDNPANSFVGLLTNDGTTYPSAVVSPSFSICGFAQGLGGFALLITQEQALACHGFLRAKAAAAGVTCSPDLFPPPAH